MSFLSAPDDRGRANRIAAGSVAVVLLLFGFAAIPAGLGHPFGGQDGGEVLGLLKANLLSAAVHLALGSVLLAAAVRGTKRARLANRGVGGACLLLAVYGLIAEDTWADLLATNGGDNDLHLVLVLVLLAVGVLADRMPTHGHGPKYRTVRY